MTKSFKLLWKSLHSLDFNIPQENWANNTTCKKPTFKKKLFTNYEYWLFSINLNRIIMNWTIFFFFFFFFFFFGIGKVWQYWIMCEEMKVFSFLYYFFEEYKYLKFKGLVLLQIEWYFSEIFTIVGLNI